MPYAFRQIAELSSFKVGAFHADLDHFMQDIAAAGKAVPSART
jgi:hypothetical protein